VNQKLVLFLLFRQLIGRGHAASVAAYQFCCFIPLPLVFIIPNSEGSGDICNWRDSL